MPVQCLLSKCGGLVLHPAQKRLIKAAVRYALPASSCSDSRQTTEMPLVPWPGTALQSKLPLVVEWCGAAYLVLLLCCAGLPHPPACANARALGLCCTEGDVVSLSSLAAHKAVWCLSLDENGFSSEWRPFQGSSLFFQ